MANALKASTDRAYRALDDLVQAKTDNATYEAVREATVSLYLNDRRPKGPVVTIGFRNPSGDLDILRTVSLARLVREMIEFGYPEEECELVADEFEALAGKLRRYAR